MITKYTKKNEPILFDDEDAEIAALSWHLNHEGYARCAGDVPAAKKYKTRRAHRMVVEKAIGRPLKQGEVVDHRNGVKTDNRRDNLQAVTVQQNVQHRKAWNPTGYRGVSFHKGTGKWQASVKLRRKDYYCGLYGTPEQAAEAAALKRREFGFYAGQRLNPKQSEAAQ